MFSYEHSYDVHNVYNKIISTPLRVELAQILGNCSQPYHDNACPENSHYIHLKAVALD